jgi:hypothetical protein
MESAEAEAVEAAEVVRMEASATANEAATWAGVVRMEEVGAVSAMAASRLEILAAPRRAPRPSTRQ